MAELVRQSQENWPASRALAISTQPYREAGAEIDQELAICLSTGADYLRRMEGHGVEPEATADELTLIVSTGQQIFLEIAKLRALRALWGQMLQACGVESTRQPWIHAAVLRRSLPSRDPSFNLLRVTTASWAAIMGEADSIETPAYDWYDEAPESGRGRRLARNTQLILGLEAELGRVVDPGGGSYFLETVTQELMGRSWALFQEIESQGGLAESLSTGWIQKSIASRWEERRRKLAAGDIALAGVNTYADSNRRFHRTSDDETRQVQGLIRERLARQREGVDSHHVSGPAKSQNRWQWCLEAAAEDRSLEEMKSVLYGGEGGATVQPLRPHRDSEPNEAESERS
jgi:methylmalonyl-CoA mutase